MKKRKSIAARLGMAALALTLITTSLSSGTLAKYQEDFKATTAMTIAKWNVGAKIGATSNSAEMTAMTANLTWDDLSKTATTPATNNGAVQSSRIAPGMKGVFYVGVGSAWGAKDGANTEVAVDYKIWIKPNSTAALPSNFVMKNGSSKLDFTKTSDGSVTYDEDKGWQLRAGVLPPGNHTMAVDVNWEWEDSNASADTSEAKRATSTGNVTTTFTILVEFEQKNVSASVGASAT